MVTFLSTNAAIKVAFDDLLTRTAEITGISLS